MNFITVKNQVITGVHCGKPELFNPESPYFEHAVIEFPEGRLVATGDTLDFYSGDFIRKPIDQLVAENLIHLSEEWCIKDGRAVKKTDEELVKEGLKEPAEGFKVVDKQIVSLTLEEKLSEGLLTQTEYDRSASEHNQAELSQRISQLTTPENNAQAMIDEKFAKAFKSKISTLLAVKQQSGWPLSVNWPEFSE